MPRRKRQKIRDRGRYLTELIREIKLGCRDARYYRALLAFAEQEAPVTMREKILCAELIKDGRPTTVGKEGLIGPRLARMAATVVQEGKSVYQAAKDEVAVHGRGAFYSENQAVRSLYHHYLYGRSGMKISPGKDLEDAFRAILAGPEEQTKARGRISNKVGYDVPYINEMLSWLKCD